MSDGRERANFDTLYATIFDELARGRYKPGDRIGLKALSDILGVSTTPMREALSRLVGRDVVTERRSEGYYLARLDARDIAELYHLHHACIERAIARAPAAAASVPDCDIWHLFDVLVVASGDRVLAGVRRYIDDRLKLVRRCERALLADEDEAAQSCRTSLAASDAQSLRALVQTFHAARIEQAAHIAELVNRDHHNQIY